MTFSINRNGSNQITKKIIMNNPIDLVPTNNMTQDNMIIEESYPITSPTINTFVLDSNAIQNTTYRSWWVKINDEIIEIASYDANSKTVTLKYNFNVIPSAGDTAYLFNLVSASFSLNESDNTVSIIYKKGKNNINNLEYKLGDINLKSNKYVSLGTDASTSPTTGSVLLSGGLGINCSTDSTNIDNGGAITIAGGASIKKKAYLGSLNVGGVDITQTEINGLQYITSLDVTPGTASASKAIILDSNKDITGIHNLETDNLTVNGTLITATATELNFTDTTPGTAEAGKALVVDVNKDISSIRNLSATQLSGEIQTVSQPKITSVGTLTSLSTGDITLNGTLINSTATEINYNHLTTGPGTAEANKSIVLDLNKDITSIRNLTATGTITADTITGTLSTHAQTGITSVGTLTSLSVGDVTSTGTITTPNLTIGSTALSATATELNYNDLTTGPGTAEANKSVVLDNNKDITSIRNLTATGTITANTLAGTLSTYSQTGITSVGTLTSLSTGDITLNGTLITSTSDELNYNDLTTGPGTAEANKSVVLDSSKDITGINNVTLLGTMTTPNLTIGSTALSATATELNYNDLTTGPGTAEANKSVVLNGTKDITGINDVTILGTLTTPNLTIGSTVVTSTAAKLNYTDITTLGTAQVNKVLTTNASNDVTGINNLTATQLSGEIQTVSQPKITSVGTLTSLSTGNITLNGTLITSTADELNYNHLTTGPGTAEASKSMVLDSNKDITSIRNLTASGTITAATLAGALSSPSQTAITAVGTLTSLSTGNITLNGTLITSTAAELNYNHLTTGAGTAEASKAMVLDSNKDITSIRNLTATGTITAATLAGTLSTAAQTAITSVGTLSSLTVSGSAKLGTTSTGGVCIGTSTDTTRMLSCLNSGLTAGTGTAILTLGQANSTNNQAELTFNYISSGSASNRLDIGLNGNTVKPISILGSGIGFFTSNPAKSVEINSASGDCLRLTYNDSDGSATVYTDLTVDSAGTLKVNSSNNTFVFGGVDVNQRLSVGTSSTSGVIGVLSIVNSSSICYIQAGLNTTSGSAADVFIGNYLQTKDNSSRKIMFKADGTVGFGTTTPSSGFGLEVTSNVKTGGHYVSSYGLHSMGYDANTTTFMSGKGPGAHIHYSSVNTAQFFGYDYGTSTWYDTCIGSGNSVTVKANGNILMTNTVCINTTGITASRGYKLDLGATNSDCNIALYATGYNDTSVYGFGANNSALQYISPGAHSFISNASSFPGNIRMYIASNGNVGIGNSSSPGCAFEVNSGTCRITSQASPLTGAGLEFGYSSGTGIANIYSYDRSGGAYKNINFNDKMYLSSSGYLGIGSTSPTFPLYIYSSSSGAATTPSGATWNYKPYTYSGVQGGSGTTPGGIGIYAVGRIFTESEFDVQSDRRVKENISLLREDYCIGFVKEVDSFSYNYKKTPNREEFGFIAQELITKGYGVALINSIENDEMEASIDEETGFENPKGIQFTVSYDKVVPILTNALKQTILKTESLEEENKNQKNKIDDLESRLARLERLLLNSQ